MIGNKKQIWDYVDLFFLKLSKINRRKMSAQFDDEFYNSFFTQTDVNSFFSGLDRRRTIKHTIIKDKILANIPRGGSLLDVGCGIGDNLYPLKDNDINIFGVEYSQSSIKIAQAFLPDSIILQSASATNLPYISNFFDSVLCIEVLEHIADQWQALREINRVLKDEGLLILSVPYRHWFPSYFNLMGHYRHYTKDDLSEILLKMGFQVHEFLPNYPNWHRFANYCYVLTRITAKILGLMSKGFYPHEVKIPFNAKPMLIKLYDLLDPLLKKDSLLNYGELQTSTFILAQKYKSL